MYRIVAAILCLQEHRRVLIEEFERYRPSCCPHCGSSELWSHGSYTRQADRNPGGENNPVPIPRFYCKKCGRTCSRLPSCISPHRWYSWKQQQEVLIGLLSKMSLNAMAEQFTPGRDTCRRWWQWLKEKTLIFKSYLCSADATLGRVPNDDAFWELCFQHHGLESAMTWLDQHGVVVP